MTVGAMELRGEQWKREQEMLRVGSANFFLFRVRHGKEEMRTVEYRDIAEIVEKWSMQPVGKPEKTVEISKLSSDCFIFTFKDERVAGVDEKVPGVPQIITRLEDLRAVTFVHCTDADSEEAKVSVFDELFKEKSAFNGIVLLAADAAEALGNPEDLAELWHAAKKWNYKQWKVDREVWRASRESGFSEADPHLHELVNSFATDKIVVLEKDTGNRNEIRRLRDGEKPPVAAPTPPAPPAPQLEPEGPAHPPAKLAKRPDVWFLEPREELRARTLSNGDADAPPLPPALPAAPALAVERADVGIVDEAPPEKGRAGLGDQMHTIAEGNGEAPTIVEDDEAERCPYGGCCAL